MENDVQILEKFCRELYTTNDASIRNRAEIAVVELSKDQQCLDKCILLFKRKDSAYSQVLAATTLQKLIAGGGTISSQVASQCQQLSFPQKLELRNFVLEYRVVLQECRENGRKWRKMAKMNLNYLKNRVSGA